MKIEITPVSGDRWLIKAQRGRGGQTAVGQVVVIQSTAPTPDSAPHAPLAGARAWLALAKAHEAANDADGAIADAQAGLAELGRGYHGSGQGIKDDTRLHIELAEDLLENGRQAEGVRALIGALESRLSMYARLHADTIALEG
jgi:hypothetical protein